MTSPNGVKGLKEASDFTAIPPLGTIYPLEVIPIGSPAGKTTLFPDQSNPSHFEQMQFYATPLEFGHLPNDFTFENTVPISYVEMQGCMDSCINCGIMLNGNYSGSTQF